MSISIDLIAGARPNFMKVASILDALAGKTSIPFRLIHTGQHFDHNMSGSFFEQLGIPSPDINFNIGGGTQAEQAAGIMQAYEQLLESSPSNLCLVVGDVTSTMACSVTAKKMHLKVAHVEAGIRSGDIKMPEEVNRIVTDSITDYFFTTSETANSNLRQSGIAEDQIFFVGNTMIDTLLKHRNRFTQPDCWTNLNLSKGNYLILTLHRPSNVDEGESLVAMLNAIAANSRSLPLVFPVHPRTAKALADCGHLDPNIHLVEPLPYLEFNYLVENSKAVVTDSGGITEETTVMGIPCLTLRETTERPETITMGTNVLVGTSPSAIERELTLLFEGKWKPHSIPPLWDGKAGNRIVDALLNLDF